MGRYVVEVANFLTTESGQVLLPQGIQQLSTVMSSFNERDWEKDSLAQSLTSALAAGWKHVSGEITVDVSLREAFLRILMELCSRSVAEAIHLRDRISQIISVS
jgi:hypothetical protein